MSYSNQYIQLVWLLASYLALMATCKTLYLFYFQACHNYLSVIYLYEFPFKWSCISHVCSRGRWEHFVSILDVPLDLQNFEFYSSHSSGSIQSGTRASRVTSGSSQKSQHIPFEGSWRRCWKVKRKEKERGKLLVARCTWQASNLQRFATCVCLQELLQ